MNRYLQISDIIALTGTIVITGLYAVVIVVSVIVGI